MLKLSIIFLQIKDSVNTAFLVAIIKYRRDPDLKNAVDSMQWNVSCLKEVTGYVNFGHCQPNSFLRV